MDSIIKEIQTNIHSFQKIGGGFSSDVYEYIKKDTSYAVKIFHQNVCQNEIQNEVQILSQINSPYVVQFFYFRPNMIIMEKFGHYNLLDYVLENNLSPTIIKNIFIKILYAIIDLYQKGVFHRDIKLENILINKDTLAIKLCDFGFSAVSHDQMKRSLGTIGYMAPELFDIQSPTINGDEIIQAEVFALGVILFNLTFKSKPFTNFISCSLWKNIKEGNWDEFWKSQVIQISKNQQILLQGMLNPCPQKRVTLSDIICSEYVQQKF